MSDTDLIERLAAAVAERIAPALPIDVDLWSAVEIGRCLKVSDRQVIEGSRRHESPRERPRGVEA